MMMRKEVYGFIVWFIATLFVVYSFCLNTAAAVFAIAIKTSLHATDLGVSIATGAFILGFACMQIPAGYLLDKFNARYVISSGVFLLALGNISISFADNLIVFTISNFLQGIGASFAFVGAGILISQWFSAKIFPILFGLTQTLSCILAGIIHYFFTLILATHTWIDIYRALSVYGLVLFILSFCIIKSPSALKKNKNVSLKNSLQSVLANKQIWLCTIACALSFGVLLAYASFWYVQVQKFYGVQNLEAVIISGMIFAGIGIGTPLLGWYSNMVKSRIMVIHLTLVLGTMFLMMGLFMPHFNTPSLIPIKIISFFIGLLLSGSMLFYTVVSEISSNTTRGVALSVLNTGVFLLNTLMLFIPYLFKTTVSVQFFTYLWIMPFSVMIAILVLYFVKDSYKS
jgi:MFS family permease